LEGCHVIAEVFLMSWQSADLFDGLSGENPPWGMTGRSRRRRSRVLQKANADHYKLNGPGKSCRVWLRCSGADTSLALAGGAELFDVRIIQDMFEQHLALPLKHNGIGGFRNLGGRADAHPAKAPRLAKREQDARSIHKAAGHTNP
jgi:hypothetical protein